MRAIISSSKSWSDEQAVIDAVCELPAGTVVLLPSRSGACKVVWDNLDALKLEAEDWAEDEDDFEYEHRGSIVNTKMLQTDVDICFAFVTKNSHSAKDLVRQARTAYLDVRVVEG